MALRYTCPGGQFRIAHPLLLQICGFLEPTLLLMCRKRSSLTLKNETIFTTKLIPSRVNNWSLKSQQNGTIPKRPFSQPLIHTLYSSPKNDSSIASSSPMISVSQYNQAPTIKEAPTNAQQLPAASNARPRHLFQQPRCN